MISYLLENKQNSPTESHWLIDNMIADLKDNANNDFWTEFNLRFTEVNREFYEKLN